jgi:hypothetical protein
MTGGRSQQRAKKLREREQHRRARIQRGGERTRALLAQHDRIAALVQQQVTDGCQRNGIDPVLACAAYARVGALVLNTLALGQGWFEREQVRLPYAILTGALVVVPDPDDPSAVVGFASDPDAPVAGVDPDGRTGLYWHTWIAERTGPSSATYIDFSALHYPAWTERMGRAWRQPERPTYVWADADALPSWIALMRGEAAATAHERALQRTGAARQVIAQQWASANQILAELGL